MMASGRDRTAGYVNVKGEHPVDAASAGIAPTDDASGRGAGSHGDHDARVRDGLDSAADGVLQVTRDGVGHDDPVGVARGGDEIDAAATHVVHRVQESGELLVVGVAGAGVQVAEVQRSGEHSVDVGRGAGRLGGRVRCWFRHRGGRVVGHHLDPQISAGTRRELEIASHRDRAGPWIFRASPAEDAPREVERNAAASLIEAFGDGTRGADSRRRQVTARADDGCSTKAAVGAGADRGRLGDLRKRANS